MRRRASPDTEISAFTWPVTALQIFLYELTPARLPGWNLKDRALFIWNFPYEPGSYEEALRRRVETDLVRPK